MATLNVTPCKGIFRDKNVDIPTVNFLDTDQAIDVADDDTATALPMLHGNTNADYYQITASADMKIGIGASTIAAADCKTLLKAGTYWIRNKEATHIIKDDE